MSIKTILWGSLLASGGLVAQEPSVTMLIQPDTLIVDHSLPQQTLAAEILAARRYDTFWDKGDETLARAALASDFIDNTLPSGRPQGVSGVLKTSNAFRAAIPDLRCEVRQMIVAGDRVVAHLHFTGSFMRKAGQGQKVDFIATDIYRVAGGRIVEDWHLEDNLTFPSTDRCRRSVKALQWTSTMITLGLCTQPNQRGGRSTRSDPLSSSLQQKRRVACQQRQEASHQMLRASSGPAIRDWLFLFLCSSKPEDNRRKAPTAPFLRSISRTA